MRSTFTAKRKTREIYFIVGWDFPFKHLSANQRRPIKTQVNLDDLLDNN